MTDVRCTLAIDIEGVLLDWSVGFDAWLRDNRVFSSFPLVGVRHFNFCGFLGHLPHEDRLALIRRFNTDEAMGALLIIAGAEETVRRLRAHGLRLVAITAPGDDPITIRIRRAQLERFALDDVEILGLNANKTAALLCHNAHAFVDDNPKKIAEVEAANGSRMKSIPSRRASLSAGTKSASPKISTISLTCCL